MKPIVEVRQGRLEGFTEDSVHKFLGVPYAAPPVGDLRWRPPASPKAWDGTRDATRFGPCCVQTIGASFNLRVEGRSEDCLYLNVWTASLDPDRRNPVMVWIHGGGNLGGAGSEDAFDGSAFAARGVTLVTINYRLGAFGFLAHPTIGANFAVLDWVAALSWVRENIAGFGGDPGNVTIFGESAGAVAVRMLLSCPLANGLFHKAVMQSGGAERAVFAPELTYENARQAATQLFDRVGTADPAKLRQLPSELIGRASHDLCGIPPPPGRIHTPANLVWLPFADGEIVLAGGDPLNRPDVPILMGCTENEARYFIKPGGVFPIGMLAGMAAALCGSARDKVVTLFSGMKSTSYELIDKLFTTVIFTEPAYEAVHRFARLGRRVFYYHFNRVAPGAALSQDLARHTGEIRYVFGTLTKDGYYNEHDQKLSEQLLSAWVEFARTGTPRAAGGEAWPEFNHSDPQMMNISDDLQNRPFKPTELIEIVNSLRAHSYVGS